MKNNFKQPKYILPLIVLPFIFIFNFLILDFFPEKKEELSKLEEKEEMNTSLPDPNMNKIGIDTKLDNLKNAFKSQSDYSAISEEIKEGEINDNIEESLYTSDEALELSKLKDSLKELKSKKSFNNKYSTPYKASKNRERENLKKQKEALKQQNKVLSSDEQFIKEMKMIDSLLNPSKYNKPQIKKKNVKPYIPIEKAHIVLNSENLKNPYFNTVSTTNYTKNVEGLIDEKIKVYRGSRVRIKLASKIVVDGVEIPKHEYIYGIVKNFKAQRIEISVKNILVNNVIYDVDLDVFDLDGMKGLYVPSSKFKEFTQQLGSEGSKTTEASLMGQNENQTAVQEMVNTVVQTTTKTVSKLIRKNKAVLKYNTKVYLINNKKQ